MHVIRTKKIKKPAKGAAVLITMISLLFIVSLTILSGAKTSKANSVLARNAVYQEQAFEAASGGLEYGLSFLKDNLNQVLVDVSENNGSGNGYIDAYTSDNTTNVDNGDNTTFSVSFTNPIANNFNIIQLVSVGTSDAGNQTSTLTQLAISIPYMSWIPQAGLIAYEDVSLGGNVSVENTVNGNTIWTGGSVSLTGSASTNGGNGISSDRNNTSSDINENDSQLSSLSGDQFFESFIGKDKATAEEKANLVLTYNGNQNLSSVLDDNLNDGKAIWVNQNSGTASFSGNANIGTQESPVILIIDGNFKANGNTEIWGVVYVTQDWNNTGGGNLTVHGAVIVEGDYSGNGTPDIIYDATTLQNTQKIVEFAQIPGGWRDF